ncbi:MAG: ECF RNA polymerase sigma factor SigR [Phycisphaerales bacterium]|nr:ECF RNA polymerase sigma factor SigR [Phycisphaerales bacterium]
MDRAEFEHQALEHFEAIYRMAYHLTGNHERAEDLVQEVYVRALRPQSVEAFNPHGGGMKSYLLVICHNAHYSALKKASRESGKLVSAEDAVDHRAGPADDRLWIGRYGMDWEQVDERLKNAIERLSPEFREVLLLWSVEQFKYREIADVLGVRIGTVMSRLYRARQMLTDALRDGSTGDDPWKIPDDSSPQQSPNTA